MVQSSQQDELAICRLKLSRFDKSGQLIDKFIILPCKVVGRFHR
jgi:hypothetical protein